jgi:hypothetical protein
MILIGKRIEAGMKWIDEEIPVDKLQNMLFLVELSKRHLKEMIIAINAHSKVAST